MHTLRTYIDMKLKDFPNTQETAALKASLIATMEQRFAALLAEGNSENEAIGILIQQLDDINEFKKSHNIQMDKTTSKTIPTLSSTELNDFLTFRKQFSLFIGIGVVFCILAAGSTILLEGTSFEELDIVACLVLAAIGVAFLVYFGIQNNKYETIHHGLFQLSPTQHSTISKQAQQFNSAFAVAITSGVVLCILISAFYLYLQTVVTLPDRIADAPMILVAIPVFIFVFYGNQHATLQRLLHPKECRKEYHREAQLEKKYDWLYSITMPLAAVVYLILGFIYQLWGIAWVVFPVTAILTAVATGILDYRRKK